MCILLESSVACRDPSAQTVSCEILEKETFWKVSHVVCIISEEIVDVNLLQVKLAVKRVV